MPNWARFNSKVQGKKKDVETFVSILRGERPEGYNVVPWRLLYEDPDYEITLEDLESHKDANPDDTIVVMVNGYCAWGMLDSFDKDEIERKSMDPLYINTDDIISIQDLTYKLDLVVEAYAMETNMGFEEHLLYVRGPGIIYQSCDVTFDYDCDDNDDKVGGFPNWDYILDGKEHDQEWYSKNVIEYDIDSIDQAVQNFYNGG